MKIYTTATGSIRIPESWSEVTLGAMIAITDLVKEDSEEQTAEEQAETAIRWITAVSGATKDMVEAMSISDGAEALRTITGWSGSEMAKTPEYDHMILGENRYDLVPFEALTLGEHASLDAYQRMGPSGLALMAATLYRPAGEKYDTNTCRGREELFKGASAQVVTTASLFFSLTGTYLMESSDPSFGPAVRAMEDALTLLSPQRNALRESDRSEGTSSATGGGASGR